MDIGRGPILRPICPSRDIPDYIIQLSREQSSSPSKTVRGSSPPHAVRRRYQRNLSGDFTGFTSVQPAAPPERECYFRKPPEHHAVCNQTLDYDPRNRGRLWRSKPAICSVGTTNGATLLLELRSENKSYFGAAYQSQSSNSVALASRYPLGPNWQWL